ncbi:hypothetical protein CI238_00764 [Colletotrichum incanum]|uniref:Uncharacterized protein n=1 Tax=Colletotrichum incanum TaxID=1573173 RepID=A0A166RPS3_COLIC|nr:hypothetical protein CI238_00764 [Colletotrichum incanum]OHW89429.1 hypothetical protein CSPAE12_11980 [Colletotrichum incanum]
MSYQIYTGVWTDWSLGRFRGATITLSARNGALLLAFIAIFVTLIAARLWRVISFICHQILASDGKHDGLYYQRQFILRNIPAPIAATWLFLQQAWHWRGHAKQPLLRTIPWAIYGLSYAFLLGLAAIFSSKISDSATEYRLLAATDCGLFVPNDRDAFQQKSAYDNSLASIYARQCYGDSSATSCSTLPVPSIRWTNESAECPFSDDVCMGSRSFRMKTGMIDSHTHLGINQPQHNRIYYWRETECSPLVTQRGFSEFVNGSETQEFGWDDNVLIKYFYGNLGSKNYTYVYNTYGESMNTGYSTWVIHALAGKNDTLWRPVEALSLNHRDITLLFIAPNSIIHLEPNDDPVFGANIRIEFDDGDAAYRPDRYVSPIACVDRHRICNPNNDICTAPQGGAETIQSARGQDIGLNAVQLATLDRIGFYFAASTFQHLIWTRTQSFLKAQELVAELTQLTLPSNQWQVEMESLFADNLAKLQHYMLEYVTGPSLAVNGVVEKAWERAETSSRAQEDYRAAQEDMCHKQKIKGSQGTINFSAVGLSLFLGLGSVFIAFSYLLEFIAQFLQRITGLGVQKAKRWERDENLQVMRMLFELKDAGVWKGLTDSFPTTESKDSFEYDGDYPGQNSHYSTIVHENYGKS